MSYKSVSVISRSQAFILHFHYRLNNSIYLHIRFKFHTSRLSTTYFIASHIYLAFSWVPLFPPVLGASRFSQWRYRLWLLKRQASWQCYTTEGKLHFYIVYLKNNVSTSRSRLDAQLLYVRNVCSHKSNLIRMCVVLRSDFS